MALSGKLYRGTRFVLGFKSTAHNLAATPFTVVAGQSGQPRKEWKWRPGGGTSSPEFYWDPTNSRLVFTLTSRWTVDGFALGKWVLHLLVGPPPTRQDNMTEYTLTVRDGKDGNGPLPADA